MTGFYMECNIRLKWVKDIFFNFKLLERMGVVQILSRRKPMWLMKPSPKYFFFNLEISFILLASCFVVGDLKCVFEVI